MAAAIFVGGLAVCLAFFAVCALLDKGKGLLRVKLHPPQIDVKPWRQRLNTATNGFVAFGAEKLLAKAASRRSDRVVAQYTGATLQHYQGMKTAYVALSYAYSAAAAAVHEVENGLAQTGAKKLLGAKRAVELSERQVIIKEVRAETFTRVLALPKGAPQPPSYLVSYLLDFCDKQSQLLQTWLKQLTDAPGNFGAQLANADTALAACEEQQKLLAGGLTYAPYQERVSAIQKLRGELVVQGERDPMGATKRCADLSRLISALSTELTQVAQMLQSITEGVAKLADGRAWVAQVRGTVLSCPWADLPAGDPPRWLLNTTDSDPDPQFAQCETLFNRAKEALAAGNREVAEGERKQAVAVRDGAQKMVQALIEAKNAIDEQVPRVRAQVSAIHEQLVATSGDHQTDMGSHVQRALDAVEQRLAEVRSFYNEQKFSQSLSLLTGEQGNEHGMPISKLLAQAKELLRLLQEANKVAAQLTK